MHHIQAKILTKHFAYHLDQLLKEKLIVKKDRNYHLSPKGLSVIDRLSHNDMHERLQPHIVTAIDLTTTDGKTLLFTRNFQPFLHLTGLPLGKVHYEETIAQAATRELKEKTGLQNIPLTHRGLAYIEARQDDVVISKVLYHVFHGNVAEPLPTTTPAHRGTCKWADHTTVPAEALMPGFLRIKSLLTTSNTLFFDEIVTDLSFGT
jgi:ADP-ribose pyrophosphatase YjhB (NUDIX family)